MDNNDIRTLKILEEIGKDEVPSQRDLANELNISLGLVNSFIKRLANKGYFKIINIQRNRVKYLLTPKGVAEKSRLTYEFIKLSYQFYSDARQKLRQLYASIEEEGCYEIVFYGAGDLAEIAYISTHGTEINPVAVVDDHKVGEEFHNMIVLEPFRLKSLSFDRILITDLDNREDVLTNISKHGISQDKVIMLE